MSKTEWPTATRLEQLRSEGKVPFSPVASALLGLAGLLAGFAFSADRWRELANAWRQGMSSSDLDAVLSATASVSSPLLEILLIPIICAFLAVVVGGLVQTKFLIYPQALQLNFGRLAQIRNLGVASLLVRIMWGIVLSSIGIVFSYLLFQSSSFQLLSMLNLDRTDVSNWFQKSIRDSLPVACAYLFMGAVVVWFFARIRFMFGNKMTRAELEQEAREE